MFLKNKLKYTISQGVILLTIFSFLLPAPSYGLDEASQKILDLRKQIEDLTKQSEQFKGTITQKQKQANTLQKQIDVLNAQINQLTAQISITEKQITASGLEIGQLNGQIYDVLKKIDKNEQAVAVLVKAIYDREQDNLLVALIKNPTLSSIVTELHDSQNINSQLTTILTHLKQDRDVLENNKTSLEEKKTELEVLNKKRSNQAVALKDTQSDKNSLLKQTKGEEARYQALLNENEKKQEEFFSQLKELEGNAIASGAVIVHVTATSVPSKGSKVLKWPMDSYRITQGFGYTTYARRGAYGGAPHNGIDAASGCGDEIHPVAHGFVLASGYNDGFGNWMAVRHDGNTVSIYGHMNALTPLANNTEVNTNDTIGYEGHTGNATGCHLHLSFYRDFFTYINPKNGQLYFNYFEGSLNPLDYL